MNVADQGDTHDEHSADNIDSNIGISHGTFKVVLNKIKIGFDLLHTMKKD